MTVKILTVDDSKTIRMIVKKAFKPFDVELVEAENGVEGLAIADKAKPDLIILDITMPVMTGIEMLAKLKEQDSLKDIPVIMLTAESGKENVMQIVKMGVKDYMVKPFKGEQLIDRASKFLDIRRLDDGPSLDKEYHHILLDGDICVVTPPDKISRGVMLEVDEFFKSKANQKTGVSKLVLDLGKVAKTNVNLIELVVVVIKNAQKEKVHVRVVGSETQAEEFKGFQETSDIPIHPSVAEAKSTF
jgi:CheY-like chemotaxis protein